MKHLKTKDIKNTLVRQREQSDCGVACLASVVTYHQGNELSLEKLRQLTGTNIKGTTLLGLFHAAQQLGFEAQGLEADNVENLCELEEPAVLHIVLESNLQHYVIFYRFDSTGRALIGDPAKGLITYSKKELDALWKTRTLLKLRPGPDFVRAEHNESRKWNWILDLIRDDFNILLVSMFLGVVISMLSLSTAIFSQKLIDKILPSEDISKLWMSLGLVTVLLLVRSGIAYMRGFFMLRQGIAFNHRVIQKFYGSLLRLPKLFFDTRKTGELIARMNDTSRIQGTINIISGNVVIDVIMIIVSIGFILYYSPWIALLLLSCLPFYFWISFIYNGRIVTSHRDMMSTYANTESHYVDTMDGIGEIKTFNSERLFEDLNKRIYGSFQNKVFALGNLKIRFGIMSEIVGVVFLILTFGISSWLVLNKSLQLGEMVAILSITSGLLPAINRLVIANISIQEARVAFDRMFEFTSIEPEYKLTSPAPGHVEPFNNLRITDLSFRFAGRREILKNINLTVSKGEMVALLGESGSGKSTLLQILQKFYTPESGEITINGDHHLKNIPTESWRSMVAVVSQNLKIFNSHLLFNLTLSNDQAEYKKAIEFCQQTGFSKFFEVLPHGYGTLLGEEGINISSGQKQLVVLVRALLRKPQLLLLDEATSALDRKTENFVLAVLQKLKPEIGTILVTHRIKTAQQADTIYILENKTISVSGSPEALLQSENFFSESYKEIIS